MGWFKAKDIILSHYGRCWQWTTHHFWWDIFRTKAIHLKRFWIIVIGLFTTYLQRKFPKLCRYCCAAGNPVLQFREPAYAMGHRRWRSADLTNHNPKRVHPLFPTPVQCSYINSFFSGPDDPLFSDLSSLKVVGRLRVEHEDDSPLAPGEEVSCVNLFPESIWGQWWDAYFSPNCQLIRSDQCLCRGCSSIRCIF